MKQWFKKAWLKLKKWGIAVLAALGIIIGGAVYAETKDFTWVNATTRMDGSAFLAADLAETRIYCDDNTVPVIIVIDGSTAASSDFGLGAHSCFATHVDTDGQESDPSNTVTFTVLPARPSPPVLQVN